MSEPVQPWIASARMYAVAPAAAAAWRELLLRVARRARVPLQLVELPPPAPIATLWANPRKGAVFMCGLPFARARPAPYLLAAPVPVDPAFGGQPRYWSEFIVHASSPFHSLEDTLGTRLAFTSPESQSGFAAPLAHLRTLAASGPLYREVVPPQLTPQGALQAVADGRADVAAIDAYSLQLMRRYAPEKVQHVRVVARTAPRPMPVLVASAPQPALSDALLSAHEDPELQPVLADLRLHRFVRPDPATYRPLALELDQALSYWRTHALAQFLDAAFLELTPPRTPE